MDLEQKLADGHVEARSVAFTDVDTSSDGMTFSGYAAVFDHEADLGDFTESINRGAFRKSISQSGNIPMLYDHNPMLPVLATTGGGTLRLKEDGKGLRVEANVANHYMGDAVRELVKRGDIRGMSFGFVAGKGNSRVEHRTTKPHRTLVGFQRLLDVSPTWDPAYASTSAELRSLRSLQLAVDLEDEMNKTGGRVVIPMGARRSETRSVNADEIHAALQSLHTNVQALEAMIQGATTVEDPPETVPVQNPDGEPDSPPDPATPGPDPDPSQAPVPDEEPVTVPDQAPPPAPPTEERSTAVTSGVADQPWAVAARKRRLAVAGVTLSTIREDR